MTDLKKYLKEVREKSKIVEKYPYPQYPMYFVGNENKLLNEYLSWAHDCRTDVPRLLEMIELQRETLDSALLFLADQQYNVASDIAKNYERNMDEISRGEL